MPFDRCSFARIHSGEILLILVVLVSATPFVCGQSSSSAATQTVIADSNSNGLNSPSALAVGADENVFIVDTGNNRVVEEPWNSSTKAYGSQTVLIGNLYSPDGVAVSTSRNVFVVDTGNNRVVEIPWIRSSATYGAATEIGSGLNSPHGVAVAANGDVYIADTGNNRVVELPWDREKNTYAAQTTVGANLLSPEAVAVGSGGKVYIANLGNSSVVEVPPGCTAATSCTSQTIVASQETNGLANPTGVAVGRAVASTSWTTETTGCLYFLGIRLPAPMAPKRRSAAGWLGPKGSHSMRWGMSISPTPGTIESSRSHNLREITRPGPTADCACDGRQTGLGTNSSVIDQAPIIRSRCT